jgi:hypothetical protein
MGTEDATRAGAAASAETAGGADFISEFIKEDLKNGRFSYVHTRFPPEPNGWLHIGVALFDDPYRQVVEVAIVIRGIVFPVLPVVAHPFNVPLNGLDIGNILFFRVGIVKPEVALTPEFFRHGKIYIEGLAMADMEPAVRFRGKAGVDIAEPARS